MAFRHACRDSRTHQLCQSSAAAENSEKHHVARVRIVPSQSRVVRGVGVTLKEVAGGCVRRWMRALGSWLGDKAEFQFCGG